MKNEQKVKHVIKISLGSYAVYVSELQPLRTCFDLGEAKVYEVGVIEGKDESIKDLNNIRDKLQVLGVKDAMTVMIKLDYAIAHQKPPHPLVAFVSHKSLD